MLAHLRRITRRRQGRVASACAGGGEGDSRVSLALETAINKQAEPKHTLIGSRRRRTLVCLSCAKQRGVEVVCKFKSQLPALLPAVSQACLRSSSSLCCEFGLLHHFPTHHTHSQVNDILQPRPRPSLPPTYHQRYARPINPQTLQRVDDLLPATSHVDPRPRWACTTASRAMAGPKRESCIQGRCSHCRVVADLWLASLASNASGLLPTQHHHQSTTHPPMQDVAVTRRPCRQRTLPSRQSIIDEYTIMSSDLNI